MTSVDVQVLRSGIVPKRMEDALYAGMGRNDANIVLREVNSLIALKIPDTRPDTGRIAKKPKPIRRIEMDSEITQYPHRYPYLSDFRRDTAIGYGDIELMQRCGLMVFASRLKKSSIVTSLSNPRYWNIKSPDEKLQKIATANLTRVFQRHAMDILLSLDNGAVFMSKEWAYKTAEEIGVEDDGVDPGSKWWVLDKLHTAYPDSVTEVLRNKNDLTFKGFMHRRERLEPREIEILSPEALVISYNSRYGNIWGQSIYEPVFDYWFWYEVTMRSFMNFLERMGIPVVVGRAPSRGTVEREDGSVVNALDWALVVAGDVAHSTAVAIPSDKDPQTGEELYGLEYLSSDHRGEQFVKALEMLSTWILRGMIVGDRAATQSGETGSYAAAEVHAGYTELDNDVAYKSIVGQLNRWLMPDYGRYNVNPNNPPPITLMTEGLDPREKARIMQLVATAGNQKIGSGSPFDWLDWQTMFTAVDLPIISDEERKERNEEMNQEALDKQKEFNKLQAETGMPAAPNPFGAKTAKKEGGPAPRPGGGRTGAAAEARAKLYEGLADGNMVPVMLSRDRAQQMVAGAGVLGDPGGSITLQGDSDAGFASSIYNAIRSLWSGKSTKREFISSMKQALESGLTDAWNEGAGEFGVAPDELTLKETAARQKLIDSQVSYLSGFADDIIANNRSSGGDIEPLLIRGDTWIHRRNEAFSTGLVLAGQDQKFEWVLGDAEHCPSCIKLAGKVKRGSFWYERGIIPMVAGAEYLKCGGYNCKCSLDETDKPLSRGRLPNLP
jgi:hypothetical protein